MASIPEDFWNALKAGNTSDGMFWAAIGIIIGVLFLLLSIARFCLWCFEGRKTAESVSSEVQNLQAERQPVDWPSNHQQQPARPNQQPQQPYHGQQAPVPYAPRPVGSELGWNAPDHPLYQNPAYVRQQQPAPYQHAQPDPAKGGNNTQQGPNVHHVQHAQQPQQKQQQQHDVLAPAYPSKPALRHQGSIRWSKEDFESVFSDKASIDMMHGASSPAGHSPDDKPLLQQQPPHATPLAGGVTQQPSEKRHTPGSALRGSSPPKGAGRMGQKPPTQPPKPKGASPDKHSSPQRGGGFHANVEELFKAHASMHEPEEQTPSNFAPPFTPQMHASHASHQPKRSGSMHSTQSRHSTPPSANASIPSKFYNTKTPSVYSPSEYTPSERTTQSHTPTHVPTPPRAGSGSGSPAPDAAGGQSPPWAGSGYPSSKVPITATPSPSPTMSTPPGVKGGVHQSPGGAIYSAYAAQSQDAKWGSMPRLQPPLPVSPRVGSLADNSVAQPSDTTHSAHASAAATAAQPLPQPQLDALLNAPHATNLNRTATQTQQATSAADPPPSGAAAAPLGSAAGGFSQHSQGGDRWGAAGDAAGSAAGSSSAAAAAAKGGTLLPTAIGVGMQQQQEVIGNRFSACDTGESAPVGFPKAVNPSAYTAMYDLMLNSKKSGGLSASKSQGFHLEAELMLVGGGGADSDCSLTDGRDLGHVNIDNTHTVAAVDCNEDATLSEFLGLTRQRHVQAQFVDKTVDRNDRALSLAIWDLGVRFFKLRRRDEAQFAIMRRMHRLPTSPESRFWKQAIDIDFEANHFHPALGCRMTVSGTEEVILVEIANQSGMWLDLRLPPQPPPGVTHERWVKLVMQEGSVVSLPKGCTYMLAMPENGMVGLLRAHMSVAGAAT